MSHGRQYEAALRELRSMPQRPRPGTLVPLDDEHLLGPADESGWECARALLRGMNQAPKDVDVTEDQLKK